MAKDIKLYIEAILKNKQFQNGVRGLQSQGEKTQSVWSKAWKVIGGLATINVILKGFKKLIEINKEFEQSIANVQSVSGATRKELEKMSRVAGSQGLGFTAKEAADAMYFLASAGLDVKDMSEVLTPSLQLAAAAQMDIADATDLVVNQLKTFQQDMSQAERFTDIMAQTVASSNTNMQQLGDALSYAGSVAATTGIDFQDLNILIASMADLGIKGGRAGVQLRMALTRLIKPTSEAEAALAKYNISTENIAKLLPTPIKLFERLRDAGMSNADMLTVFGVRQTNVIGLIKNGTEFIEKNRKAIEDYGGAAKKMADTQLNSLQGALKNLKSTFEDLSIEFVQNQMPLLKELVNWFSKFLKKIPDAIMGYQIFIYEMVFESRKWLDVLKVIGEHIGAFATTSVSHWKYVAKEAKAAIQATITESNIERDAFIANLVQKQEAEIEYNENKAERDAVIAEEKMALKEEEKAAEEEEWAIKEEKEIAWTEFVISEIKRRHDAFVKNLGDEVKWADLSYQEKLKKAQKFNDSLKGLATSAYQYELQKYQKIDAEDTKAKKAQAEKLIKYWKMMQAAKISETIISTATAAMNAYASLSSIPFVGPGLAAVAAAAIAATGALKVAMIRGESPPSFKKGTEYTEGGPAILHPGERVIPAGINPRGITNEELIEAAMRGLEIPDSGRNTITEITNSETPINISGNFVVPDTVINKETMLDWLYEITEESGGVYMPR